ncbi:MAG: M50 family metallopeptidase [Leptospiraceae bacterium]|nr:M50 family metallopeptidase [Leptospiraceae bacterium]
MLVEYLAALDLNHIRADKGKVASKRFLLIVAIGLALTLFWDSSLLRPVKLLVVLVHEMWHGLLSLAAGVRLDGIEVHWNESGKTLVSGDFSNLGFISAVSAGYIGCALTGALLLRQALVARMERTTLVLFSVLLMYFSWLFTSPLETAFYTGTGYGLALLLLAALGERVARGTLTALGVFFLFYSLFDLFDFTRDVDSTDAAILASYLGSDALEQGSVGLTAISVSVIWTALIFLGAYLILAPAIREALHYQEAPPEQEPNTSNTEKTGQAVEESLDGAPVGPETEFEMDAGAGDPEMALAAGDRPGEDFRP